MRFYLVVFIKFNLLLLQTLFLLYFCTIHKYNPQAAIRTISPFNAHNNEVQYKNTQLHPAGSTLFERGTATVAIPQDGRKEGRATARWVHSHSKNKTAISSRCRQSSPGREVFAPLIANPLSVGSDDKGVHTVSMCQVERKHRFVRLLQHSEPAPTRHH